MIFQETKSKKMAKRFTDTNKYKKPFIRGLQGAYKLLWDYLYHDCDNAGIWIVDFEIAQLYIGKDMPVTKVDALKFFNEGKIRIIEIDNGTRWFIPAFIRFQYGELSVQNRAHISVIQILNKYNLNNKLNPPTSSLQRAKDKDMDMDMDKDMEKVKDKEEDNQMEIENLPVNIEFDVFWELYDKKVGDKSKLIKKWNHLSDSDRQAIIDYIPKYIKAQADKHFRKNPEKFLINRSWLDEIIKPNQVSGLDKTLDRIKQLNEQGA
jgi:hypothetical protein